MGNLHMQIHMQIRKFITVFTATLLLTLGILFAGGHANAASSLLRVGSRGAEVSQLQQTLKNKGFYTYNITSYFGSITKGSVIKFQKNVGLIADGIVGPKTRSILYRTQAATTTDRGSPTRPVITSTASTYEQDNIFWLARIIEAESGGESYAGKVAVGNVILNRVASPNFPNTIHNVIFDYDMGIPQFSPVADGTIYNNPSQDSYSAAREAYFGAKPIGNSLYFFNPDKAAASWIVNNRTYYTRIGAHVFYL